MSGEFEACNLQKSVVVFKKELTICLIKKLELWKGPLSFDWESKEHCKKLTEKKKLNLIQCKDACRKEEGCNAIIHDVKKSSCEVGVCAIHLDASHWIAGPKRGYFLNGGT